MNSMKPPESGTIKTGQWSRETSGGQSQHESRRTGRPHGKQASWTVETASAADHFAIHRFLLSVFQRPSASEFQAQLDDPFYEPSHRLLVRDGPEIVAHLRAIHREIRFDTTVLPVTYVGDVATLPQYRGCGCATALLQEATRRMTQDGTVLGLLCTNRQAYYERRGWVVCGRHSYAVAASRSIRSHLQTLAAEQISHIATKLGQGKTRRYTIRLWRRVERAALIRLYEEVVARTHGSIVRTPAYWQWLLSRQGHERIYVAITGRDKLTLDDQLAPIVGYAVTKGGRIVELIGAAEHPEAIRQLLLRACGDAIEQDVHSIRLDAPPGHPMHQLFVHAGGEHVCQEADRSYVYMARLPQPRELLKAIGPILYRRVREADFPSGCELGLMLEHGRIALRVQRSGVSLTSGRLGRSYLQCTAAQLTQLLLGHLDLQAALEAGRIRASTRIAERAALALFPQLDWWHPSWDFLPAH